MRRIVSFFLLAVMLVSFSGCWWHEREEHEHDRDRDRGGYGEHHDRDGHEHDEMR